MLTSEIKETAENKFKKELTPFKFLSNLFSTSIVHSSELSNGRKPPSSASHIQLFKAAISHLPLTIFSNSTDLLEFKLLSSMYFKNSLKYLFELSFENLAGIPNVLYLINSDLYLKLLDVSGLFSSSSSLKC